MTKVTYVRKRQRPQGVKVQVTNPRRGCTMSSKQTGNVRPSQLINNWIAGGPDYTIENKMSLSQAAAENTHKIVTQQIKQSNGMSIGSKTNGSNNGMSGRILTDGNKTNGNEKGTTVGDNEVMFEGTFKPQTHLGYPAYNPNGVDEGGMPFGTFGAAVGGIMPIADRPSYSEYTNEGGNQGTSFYNPSRELSIKDEK